MDFTPKQIELKKTIKHNEVTLINGAAGTGKTTVVLDTAVKTLKGRLNANQFWYKIILLKPTVQAGTQLGYLKGTLEEKIDPYLGSFNQVLRKLNHKMNETNQFSVEKIIDMKHENITFEPIQFLRGLTFENCFVIVDEAQNCLDSELHLIQTRLGEDCKMVFMGDIDQKDIDNSGWFDFFELMRDLKDDGVGTFEFGEEDIMRHPLLTKYLKARREYFDAIQQR